MSDQKAGQTIGCWTLLDLLGEGGNAEVWRAEREDGHVAAVKILKTRKTDSPRWGRFRREVDYVAGLGERDGVLPIEEYNLPEEVRAGGRAWYSMPVATPLADALGSASLHDVAAAVVPIAETLAQLWEEDRVAHRDIKPGNLYLWRERPAVGDFGLLWQPDAATLTDSGEIPGPYTFTAPELFREDLDPDEIDYSRADVFSLAKTLWAIARGATFALIEEHRVGDQAYAVGFHRPHPNSGALDRLIARATVADPNSRPGMRDFAEQLEGWTNLASPRSGIPDLSAVSAQIREQLEPALRQEQERERLVRAGSDAVRRVRERLHPLFSQLDSDVPGALTNVRDKEIEGMLRTFEDETMQGSGLLLRESIAARVSNQLEPLAYVLHMGVLVEVLENGQMRVGAAFDLGHEKVLGSNSDQSGTHVVDPGSVAEEEAINEATAWMIDNAQSWLERFANG
jgi:serine/threonine protein kinase